MPIENMLRINGADRGRPQDWCVLGEADVTTGEIHGGERSSSHIHRDKLDKYIVLRDAGIPVLDKDVAITLMEEPCHLTGRRTTASDSHRIRNCGNFFSKGIISPVERCDTSRSDGGSSSVGD